MAAAAISPSILHCFSNSQPAAHPGQCHAGQEGETRQRPSTDGFILVVNLKLVVQVHQLGLVAESVNSEPTSESLGFKFYKKKMRLGFLTSAAAVLVVLMVLLDQQQLVEARRGRGRGRTKSRVRRGAFEAVKDIKLSVVSLSGANRIANHWKISRSRV